MPRVLDAGDRIKNYTIVELVNKGNFAIAYKAQGPDGNPYFLKQYKMPTVTTPWYRGYISYQAELKRRVEATRARAFCYRFVDFFEHAPFGSSCYFQVFEFVSRGKNLKGILEQIRTRPRSISWDQRVIFARVLMAGINALHETKVVHSDLKPENIQLFESPETDAKYTLKLIDMDWSILADRTPPWHGSEVGYVGTPGYMSPEHLQGKTPVPASDVFTCGLILYELLAGGHPYDTDDEAEYRDKVLNRLPPAPRFDGRFGSPVDGKAVASALLRCLDRQPENRPSAVEMNRQLIGAASSLAPPTHPGPTSPPSPRRASPAPPPSPGVTPRAPSRETSAGAEEQSVLVLVGPGGERLEFRVPTDFGSILCRKLGGEARFWSARQFSLRREGRRWLVEPAADTTNETLLNGRAIRSMVQLKDGDVLAVGNESKRIVKSPFAVRIG